MDAYKAMEEMFGISFEPNEEYHKKLKKAEKLEKEYKERFGKEIEYSVLDDVCSVDDEIEILEKALKDNKPFVTIDAGIYEITLGGKKYKFWY